MSPRSHPNRKPSRHAGRTPTPTPFPRPTRRRRWSWAWAGAVGVVCVLFVGSIAMAYIPEVDRVLRAIAEVNRSGGRAQAIALELTMRVGDRPPVATGELVSHPSGLARLELKGFSGRVERYLLSGRELMGSRDGQLLEQPRPLLQPFFLLQPDSEATLRAALETFGVIHEAIGLAPCGDEDCFVIGDPRLAAPLPQPAVEELPSGVLEDALTDPLAELPEIEDLEGPRLGLPLEPGSEPADPEAAGGTARDSLLPRLWVDVDDLEVRRIDRAGGEFVIFGPIVRFERLKVPAWLELHEPGVEPIRFEVDHAVQVNAAAKAFSRTWLMAPAPSDASGSDTDTDTDTGAGPDDGRGGDQP